MLLLNYCFFLCLFCFIKDFCCGSSVILTMVCMWVVISGKFMELACRGGGIAIPQDLAPNVYCW